MEREDTAGPSETGGRPRRPVRSEGQRYQLLRTFAEFAAREQTLDDLLWHLAEQIGALFGFEDCVIYLRRESVLEQKAAYGIKHVGERAILSRIAVPVGEGIVGTVAATGRAEFIADVVDDPRYIADQVEAVEELAVPIVFEGEVLGVLDSEATCRTVFHQGDLELLQAVADIVALRIAWLASERRNLRQREQRRQEQLEGLGRLGAGLAHEINNSLAIIRLYSELIETQLRDNAAAQVDEDALPAIDDAVRSIGRLAERLRAFSEGGAPHLEAMDLVEAVRTAMSVLDRYPDVDAAVQTTGTLPYVLGDSRQIERALENLLVNAAEATEGRGAVDIRLGVRPSEGGASSMVFVQVRDDGPGVPAELKPHLFEPFVSTRGLGRGLGLATAYWIAERHDGSLVCLEESDVVGGGAAFEFRLPVLEGELATPVRPRSVRAGLRILVLDDEASLRRALEVLLRNAGHEVTTVADGVEVPAVWVAASARGETFDLGLFDLTIPAGVGGLEACRRLRDQAGEDVRLVVMSGYSHDPVMADPARYGFRGRLEKPFDRRALEAALAQAMDG